jgi:phosphoribosylamine---glycine ligase
MPKIVLCSYTGYGASFLLRLLEEGHSVDYYLSDDKYGKVLEGIIPEYTDKTPDFSKYDLALFDLTGKPELAESASKKCPVIGDGDFQSEIEDDRLLGIEIMEQCGINVPEYEVFDDLGAAKRFIKKTGKRYVFKPFGGQSQDTASTYVSKDADDLLAYLDKLSSATKGMQFILQEVVQGIEISTEAYFNGEDFYLVNATLEEKKFMNDNKGPNTGCAGNLVWTYDHEPYVFREGLGKMKDFLKQYKFRGMIDLNTIVSATQLYGLEWTPRFGYDASYTLYSLISSDLGNFLTAIGSGAQPYLETSGRFASAVRISIPPYPSEILGKHPEEIPIEGIEEHECVKDCYLYDACLDESGSLVTAGVSGLIAVPTAIGSSISESFSRLYGKVDRIQIPNMQYRTDLEASVSRRYKILDSQGWIS